MSTPAPRPAIAALPAYVPGARGGDGPAPIKLSSNESPYGPLPSVLEAIAAGAAAPQRYPDMGASALHARLAEACGTTPDGVVAGAGSVAVLAHILQAYAGAGDEVVFAWRSFEAYPILVAIAGAEAVRVPLDADARHDLDAMVAAITDSTKVVLVCSPNNPTGPAVHADEFAEFMARVPSYVAVVLDEAYGEYSRDPHAVRGADLLASYPNLLVLRTFSKAYGLAGMRVGYALGSPELLAPIRAVVTPFSITEPAQAAAIASLDAVDELLERVDLTAAERSRVLAGVRELGWDAPETDGNFVWLPAGDGTADVVAALGALPTPILVRPFAGEGVRITIGTPDENDALLAALPGPAAS
ncbi:histidinol-phosphate transaminase [Demequina sp.]|uniref:histidinol-phosphate transaminase n=1 Tax=Demequina sp. TaxID=2050685 RepID=UPI003D0F6A74